MTLRILYFATIRDLAGLREETVSLPKGSLVKDLKNHLGRNHPQLIKAFDSAIFAVNREFAFDDQPLETGDEVAIFPPVSGGSVDHPTILHITGKPLQMNALLAEMLTPTAGAVCVLTGVVQAHSEGNEPRETAHHSYEASASIAEEQMEQITREIRERWTSVEGLAIVQRLGEVQPGAPIIMIVCSAAHRDVAVLEAARYGLERMKQIIPIIEKEIDPG